MCFANRFACLWRGFAVDPHTRDEFVKKNSKRVYICGGAERLSCELLWRKIQAWIFARSARNIFTDVPRSSNAADENCPAGLNSATVAFGGERGR